MLVQRHIRSSICCACCRATVRQGMARRMGRAVRRLHTGMVQRERAAGTGGQSGGQGGAGDDGRQSMDATHPWAPRSAQWLSRCPAHGFRPPPARQSTLAAGSVGGGSQVSKIGRFGFGLVGCDTVWPGRW